LKSNYAKMTIKDLPEDERPREKIVKYGSSILSNAELLAILIRTGNKENSAIDLARNVLSSYGGLKFLAECTLDELRELKGIGMAKACEIKAAVELAKRLSTSNEGPKHYIRHPRDCSNLLMESMRYLKKEYFKIVLLTTKHQVISVEEISVGSLNSSIVHPREVFSTAIKKNCAAIILAHNHPSGDPSPSNEDIKITQRLIEGGKILGIEVLDHIIIGDGKFISLKEQNLI
jgi:DNA repair protein RadC